MVEKDLDTGTDQLLAVKYGGVGIVTLNRPDARNALSSELSPALRSVIVQMGIDQEVGALIITGAGNAFCAGGDVKSMAINKGPKVSVEERIAKLVDRQRKLTGALVEIRKPVIAALPGAAVGAGLSIALACDIRIGAASAFVTTGYVRVGLSGDYGISSLLTRVVGNARARELMFTAERLDSARCLELGIFSRVVPDEELQKSAFELATQLAKGPRRALALMKDNLDEALEVDFKKSLDGEAPRLIECMQSSDHEEAVSAFVEKRQPNFGEG